MTARAWEGIPEKYHPNPETPWRVAWGIGCFRDFATPDDAWRFYRREKSEGDLMGEPFCVDAQGAHYDDDGGRAA